ncbi:MAG: L-aspartate oxidase [Pirellulaceae bacterium]
MHSIPRFLVPFSPKLLPHRFTDVLIIGGGLAGMRAAMAIDPHLSVLLITKDLLDQSNSSYAQGGIAGVLGPEDRFEFHVHDTLEAGGTLCHRSVVESVIHEAPRRIHELMEWGARFDQDAGSLMLGREGGHSHHRIVHALGDSTGREVVRAMSAAVLARPNIAVLENSFTVDLLSNEDRCTGCLIALRQGGMQLVWAKQTILCSGGTGQIYRESTNPPVATGDGLAMARRAGVELRDMEFMQFHPTVLYLAGSSRSLITEAVRGEGAHLVDKNGDRFMSHYDPREELAPRDVVSQAITAQMEATQHPNVYLDLSHLDAEFVAQRFPGIRKACAEFGLDITRDRIPVRPGAHYMIGGVTVDDDGRTSMKNLWAAGEVTSSGLHGANRLASNSLLEGLVYGARAGEGASRAAAETPDSFRALALSNPISNIRRPLDLSDVRSSLKSLMWRCVGVRRDAATLHEAADSVETWTKYVAPLQFDSPQGWELQNLLTVASAMIEAARRREESRGVHFRTDFPDTNDDQWLRHVCMVGDRVHSSDSRSSK